MLEEHKGRSMRMERRYLSPGGGEAVEHGAAQPVHEQAPARGGQA